MNTTIKENICSVVQSLKHLENSGLYDVEKYTRSLAHQTGQLEYFYCHLANHSPVSHTFYHVPRKPHVHQLAYFNIGRGFPKELMDGHWCYILKDMGYKMIVVPCTSIKKDSAPLNPAFEKEIMMWGYHTKMSCRMQLSDLRAVDLQRLDTRKPFFDVLTDQEDINTFISSHLFDTEDRS